MWGTEWQIRLDGSFAPSCQRWEWDIQNFNAHLNPCPTQRWRFVNTKQQMMIVNKKKPCVTHQVLEQQSARGSFLQLLTLSVAQMQFPKEFIVELASTMSGGLIKRFLLRFFLPSEAKYNLGHEKSLNIQVQRQIIFLPLLKWEKKSLQEISLLLSNKSVKAGCLANLQRWISANWKLNDLVSRRAQLE